MPGNFLKARFRYIGGPTGESELVPRFRRLENRSLSHFRSRLVASLSQSENKHCESTNTYTYNKPIVTRQYTLPYTFKIEHLFTWSSMAVIKVSLSNNQDSNIFLPSTISWVLSLGGLSFVGLSFLLLAFFSSFAGEAMDP